MVFIDTSVWIEFFRHPGSELRFRIESVIEEAATCGVVLQEVLQGIQPENLIPQVQHSMLQHHYLETNRDVYLQAADFVRCCRRGGFALTTVDALLASVAVHHRTIFWTLDKDFLMAAQVIPIRLYA